ncbi:oxygen-independent coproporphyrinogen III oxidase [Mesorhizobium sp. KR9-304]|uniref:oxygen-independent coproporphyrinogen III oxidase n=1 Tax=Mesorhizobium sp. KR9-304 TaxID=3156614 RepID=UPI0032B3E0BC
MDRGLIDRHSAPVPRYTSYPTAPHFHAGVDGATYARWLAESPSGASVSLYLHIPFCDRLCWFCACHTKQVLRYEPIATYLEALHAEIATVAARLGRRRVTAIHLGGGSPTMLAPDDVDRLGEALRLAFAIDENCEASLEVDTNDVDAEKLGAWRRFGITRASFGVQDFDPAVQQAINRYQSFAQTAEAVEGFRERGVGSVNLDVLYGLPDQTMETLANTLDQVISLAPDRIALFGYAHVPWMKKHQRLIDEARLPDRHQRFAQARLGAAMLSGAGYVPIGLDHFARPGDGLARAQDEGRLRRNFQGYTTDTADMLVGIGASSISRLPQGYTQNVTATADYKRAALAGRLPIVRGYALTEADKAAAWVIEELMCAFGFSADRLRDLFPAEAERLVAGAEAVVRSDADRFVRWEDGRFLVTERGRPFVRTIAARFDGFLKQNEQRHSIAV